MSMMVLGNDQAFKDLCGTDRAFMDGTFSVCPRPYYQLFCVHYLHGLRMIPALYVLMTHKTAAMYSMLFTWMSGEAIAREHPLQWTQVRCDFETGIRSSVANLAGGVLDVWTA
jgi:hypothetical protein